MYMVNSNRTYIIMIQCIAIAYQVNKTAPEKGCGNSIGMVYNTYLQQHQQKHLKLHNKLHIFSFPFWTTFSLRMQMPLFS